jgi:hypothetical protein
LAKAAGNVTSDNRILELHRADEFPDCRVISYRIVEKYQSAALSASNDWRSHLMVFRNGRALYD